MNHVARLLCAALLATLPAACSGPATPPRAPLDGVRIGGPFSLIDQDGHPRSDRDFAGRYRIMYFGYTFCPDVCPTTLAETTAWRAQLNLKPDDLRIIFATVDPDRDTLPIVKSYVEGFDPSIIGLVGDQAQTDAAKAAFGVFSQKKGEPNDPYYLVDHTALIFLIKADGTFQGTIAYDEDSETALKKIKRLVQG